MHEDKQARYTKYTKYTKSTKSTKHTENVDSSEEVDGNEWEYDLELEVVDLDSPDTTSEVSKAQSRFTGTPWSVPVLRWQRPFKRRDWHNVFIASSVFLVCLLLFLNVQGVTFLIGRVGASVASRFVSVPPKLIEHLPAPILINTSLVLSSKQLGFSCVEGEAWSPDSTAIAVQGYSIGCDNVTDHPLAYATVINAHTGQLLASLFLDVPISKAFAIQYPTLRESLPQYYGRPSWSPDKRHIAFNFFMVVQRANDTINFAGVLIYDLQLKSSHVFIQPNVSTLTNQGSLFSYSEWDVIHGSAVPTPTYTNTVSIPLSVTISPAESYTWGENGKLIAQVAKIVAPSHIGNTSADLSFSVWQPGEIIIEKQDNIGGSIYTPGIFLWHTSFVAWSPDGRYLVQNASTVVLLEPPGYPKPAQNVLAGLRMKNIPIVPIRDKALLVALNSLNNESAAESDMLNALYVEWSPDGKLVWMEQYGSSAMTLYAARSGFPVALLLPQSTFKADVPNSPNPPVWSPDGLHVVSQDSGLNVLSIWNIPQSLQ